MSYDIEMVCPSCSKCKICRNADMYDVRANVTYNLSEMFVKALGPEGLDLLHGMAGKDARPLLEKAIRDMEDKADEYKKLNPPNGWGDFEGAIETLSDVRKWCGKYPEHLVDIS